MNITAVLGANRNLGLTKKFYSSFRQYHPAVPLVISCIGSSQEIREWALGLKTQDSNIRVVVGTPEDGHEVSFSELYNAGINAVTTDKLVLIHSDMIFNLDFFDILDKEVIPEAFTTYAVVEPPVYYGNPRPGKLLGSFGDTFETFDYSQFFNYCSDISKKYGKRKQQEGAFFCAGYKSLFEKVGGFDQLSFVPVFCEDDDFQVRSFIKGISYNVNYNALAFHFVSLVSRDNTRGKTMDRGEKQSNRVFARKWKFEVRFMFHYDQVNNPLIINDWTIKSQPEKSNRLKVLAPLLDNERQDQEDILLEVTDEKKALLDFLIISEVLGSLRIVKKPLKVGVYQYPGFQITIKNPVCHKHLEDNTNYLLIQRKTKYE